MAQSSQVLQTASEGGSKEEKTIFDFFGKKEPAHVGAGVGMGLRSIAKGVFAGAAGLVLQPLAGAGKGGVLGFSKGALLGENCSLWKDPIQTKPFPASAITLQGFFQYSAACIGFWLRLRRGLSWVAKKLLSKIRPSHIVCFVLALMLSRSPG
jgi:hypothetical protein